MLHVHLSILCGLFGKSRQAYYQRLNYSYVSHAHESIILDLVREYRRDMGRIGGRKLWYLLNQRLPGLVGRDELFDILDRHHLKVHRRNRHVRTTWSASWLHRFPNLVSDMELTSINQVWVSDITYLDTQTEGFVYLHLVTDAYSKKILGWSLSPTLHADYTLSALQMALRSSPCSLQGLIHHSDRGCQYCSEKYVKLLQDNQIRISMTQGGDPRDNAIAERVNGILKSEWFDNEVFHGLLDARTRVSHVINVYNSRRPHLSLNYHTPSEVHECHGKPKRVWKNYYPSSTSRSKINDVISELTSCSQTSTSY